MKVKFELNVQGETVAFIEFDGRDSNYLNWFNNSRILKSSMADIYKSQTYTFFFHRPVSILAVFGILTNNGLVSRSCRLEYQLSF